MTVALLTISDGRDAVHERALASLEANLPPVFAHRVHIDDRDHNLGFCGAVQAGWDRVLETGAEWVAHFECDFTFNAPWDIERMVGVLERHPELAQLVLKRGPVNAQEIAAGGIIEQHPDDYTERLDLSPDGTYNIWTEHRRFWSTNPGVYSTRFCRLGWPQEPESEGKFTHRLLKDPTLRFAFWQGKGNLPLVEHIGHQRAGVGY